MASPIVKKAPTFIKVGDLNPGSTGVNLIVKVSSVEAVTERIKKDGSKIKSVEALIGDETGSVILTLTALKGEEDPRYLNLVKPGSSIQVRNAKVNMHKIESSAFVRLSVDVWGLIKATDEGQNTNFEINSGKNVSTVEYELINHGGQSGAPAASS
eukprot:CAMPEP_0184348404 /NCGR_PEP_ID=MMETSP1089-20130417/27619_1 /TAXON_ID=38269 ORGANISM="Gloeochaete wittrockiana, Strain SAG46.84" /NCGR_SAMPLE_ID=MMETSP1089 /ASSEMBLY_ACC=CAM_ASM_000445 /LENGTH=155 /DNA_ID=CAMNT_0026680081 /DNA_START=77 /DNA_END=544 /DNA_ORIENTATION=-